MKRTNSLALIFLVVATAVNGQHFEGMIVYNETTKIKDGGPFVPEKLPANRREFYIKEGSFKSVREALEYTYIASENRIYIKMNDVDTLYWMDAGRPDHEDQPITRFEILKEQEEILGYKCDALVMEAGTIKTTFYFNAKISVDPGLYKNHINGHWDFISQKTKSLPLKIVTQNADITITSIATEIKRLKLDDARFALPSGLPKIKMGN